MPDKNEIIENKKQELDVNSNPYIRRGFEDEQEGDLIMPRAKMIQALSPELNDDNLADLNIKPGMLINSLTYEVLSGVFIPIFKFGSRVLWIPRAAGSGMACRAIDGLTGEVADSSRFGRFNEEKKEFYDVIQVTNGQKILCKECPWSKWDGDIPPVCTASMNFLSVYDECDFPLVNSFVNTSFKSGKKLFSLCKMRPGDMFAYKYKIKPTRKTNEKGTFFVAEIYPSGKSSEEEYKYAENLYHMFKGKDIKFHEEEEISGDPNSIENSITDEM